MKYSGYNFLFSNGPRAVLYNAASDGLLLLRSDLTALISKYKDGIDGLKTEHPDLYAAMQQRGMIVPDGEDEAEALISRRKQADTDPAHFYLTVLPTFDCNLRCWYCYEQHKAHSNMTPETLQRVIRLIDKLTADSRLKYLHLGFFGGEPLLPFKKVVWPLLQEASRLCAERGVKLLLQFTTNGVLLTDEVIEKLLSLPQEGKPHMQITLDGNRERHDRSRHTAAGGPRMTPSWPTSTRPCAPASALPTA